MPLEARRADFVPLHQVATRPVMAPALAALGLALLVLVVGAVGLGSPSHSGSLPPATVAVAHTDPASATPTLDLDRPVPVAATPASGARENDVVRLRLSAGGLPLGSGQSTLTRSGGLLQADVNVSASRYLVAGRATGRVDILRKKDVVAGRSFAARSSRSPFMTLPALATAALVLFIGGYIESLSRTLRRRRARVGPTVGMVLLGAAFGIVGVGAAWVLVAREPTATTLVLCVVLGGGAGVAGAIASSRALPKRRRRS